MQKKWWKDSGLLTRGHLVVLRTATSAEPAVVQGSPVEFTGESAYGRSRVALVFTAPAATAAALEQLQAHPDPATRPVYELLHAQFYHLFDVFDPVLAVLRSPACANPPLADVLLAGAPPRRLGHSGAADTRALPLAAAAAGRAVADAAAALTAEQAAAVAACLHTDVTLVCGAPGTGKTAVVSALLRSLAAAASAEAAERGAAVQPTVLLLTHYNHTLDSLVRTLFDQGVPPSSVLRLGGMSTDNVVSSPSIMSQPGWFSHPRDKLPPLAVWRWARLRRCFLP